jgi:hypothetical protein
MNFHLPASADNANGDFAAIRDKNFLDHFVCPGRDILAPTARRGPNLLRW